MTLSNAARKVALGVFDDMRAKRVIHAVVTTYWYDDEGHTLEEITVTCEDGRIEAWDIGDIEGLRYMVRELDGYGVFLFDATTNTIFEVGDAWIWIPEPELQTKAHEPKAIETIDPNAPELPLVVFHSDPKNDTLTPLWNELSEQPFVLKSNRIVLDRQYLGWGAGTNLDVIVQWFNQAAQQARFKITSNK